MSINADLIALIESDTNRTDDLRGIDEALIEASRNSEKSNVVITFAADEHDVDVQLHKVSPRDEAILGLSLVTLAFQGDPQIEEPVRQIIDVIKSYDDAQAKLAEGLDPEALLAMLLGISVDELVGADSE